MGFSLLTVLEYSSASRQFFLIARNFLLGDLIYDTLWMVCYMDGFMSFRKDYDYVLSTWQTFSYFTSLVSFVGKIVLIVITFTSSIIKSI